MRKMIGNIETRLERLLTDKKLSDTACWYGFLVFLGVIIFNLARAVVGNEAMSAVIAVVACFTIWLAVHLMYKLWVGRAGLLIKRRQK